MNTPAYAQTDFRGRNDDGSETTATWKDVANANWSQDVDTTFRCRIAVDETTGNGDSENNQSLQWQYQLNSGGWNNIGTATSVVKAVDSANLTDNADTTQQLLAGTFITDNNAVCEDGTTGAANWPGSGAGMDTEIALQIVGTDVSNGDTIELRVTKSPGYAISTYTNTPSITVVKATATNVNQMLFT
jgi:hypothetical protein